MLDLEAALQLIPDADLDLTGCDHLGPHGLPPPVVVTLARRPDRWLAAERTWRGHGVNRIIKATAVDGQTLSQSVLAKFMAEPNAVEMPLAHYLQMTRPAVGCFLSHLSLWKRFLQSGAERILILEDDAVPTPDCTLIHTRAVLAAMPADADMLLLGCTIMDGLAEPTTAPRLSRVYYYNGTYGYILTRNGCQKLLPRMLPVVTHIDNQISLELVRDRAGLRAYACEPRLIGHDFTVYSDVYVPVLDTSLADRRLDGLFKECRSRLLRDGAQLFPMHQP